MDEYYRINEATQKRWHDSSYTYIYRGGSEQKRTQETSGQDGGVGRHALPPLATIEKITIRSQN